MKLDNLPLNGMIYALASEHVPDDDRVVVLHYYSDNGNTVIQKACYSNELESWHVINDNGNNDAIYNLSIPIDIDLDNAYWTEMILETSISSYEDDNDD